MAEKYDSVIVHNGRAIQKLSKKINMLVWILSVLIALNLIAIVGIALTMLMNFNLTNFGVIN